MQAATKAPSSASTTRLETTSATPTPSAPAATVAQYASIVAKSRSDLDPTITELTGRQCDWTSPGAVDVDPQLITCRAGVLTIGFEAQTLSMRLTGAGKEGVPAYVGAVPAELTSIVSDTIQAADALDKAANAARDCTSHAAAGCGGKLADFYSAMTDLRGELAAWGPYGA